MRSCFQRRLLSQFAALVATFGIVATSSSAHAQGWLEDRDSSEGSGIRLGNLELHPGIGAEIGYDSNVFLSENDEQGSAILRVTPHLLLSTLGTERRGDDEEEQGNPPSVAFRGGLSASLYHFFSTSTSTNVGADLTLDLIINPERPFQVTVSERFSRTVRPFTEEGGGSHGHDVNNAGIRFDFGTSGGVFKGWLGYRFGVDLFESSTFDFATNLSHTIEAGSLWRFLPHTSIHYDLELAFQDYPNTGMVDQVLLTQNQRLRTRFGINGAFTNKFSLLALVGFSVGFYDEGDDYESIIGQLELRFQLSENTRLTFGYVHDVFPSYVGSFTEVDRGYLKLQLLIGGSFMFGVSGSGSYNQYGAVLDGALAPAGAAGTSSRDDARIEATLFGEYRLTDWLGLNGTLSYTSVITDFNYAPVVDGMPRVDPADFAKFEAWFGVRAFY